MLWSITELLEALSQDLIQACNSDNLAIDNVVIDSRKAGKNSLFIALKGENNDGHNYLNQIFENGGACAIVEYIPTDFKNSKFVNNLIIVKNSFEALNKLAIFARKRSQAKIIAITGSVGKTSTKELMKLAFSTQGKTFANFGNLNNHIGVPLSLANLEADCDFAIFEMGMNHANEIAPLSQLARPHLAIITNVGPVHIEFFKDEEGIALAKSEIFAGLCADGRIILNADNKHYQFLRKQAENYGIKESNIFSVGSSDNANYKINNIDFNQSLNYQIQASINNTKTKSYIVGTANKGSAFNSIFALACLDLIGNDIDKGLALLTDFHCSAGRGKMSNLIINGKNITIIDDTYNASIISMKSGIENCCDLKKILRKKRVICALGDMLELGDKSFDIHLEILKFVAEKPIDKVILVGGNLKEANDNINLPNSINYPDSTSASLQFSDLLADGDICYFKGSRGTKMEVIIQNLNSKNSAL